MSGAGRWVVGGFAALYLAALALLLIGTFGWFGQPRDPLAGVFLMPLGLPWNRLFDDASEAVRPWLAAGAPLLNLLVLAALFRRRQQRPPLDP